MTLSIERLQPGDEAVLDLLARDEPDFDLDGRATPLVPLDRAKSRAYLADPAVLHWIASDDAEIVGHLGCIVIPLRAGSGKELLLYEIGVRSARRRSGIGRLLLDRMEAWMRANDIDVVWVGADNDVAVDFYRACGFASDDPPPMYLSRTL